MRDCNSRNFELITMEEASRYLRVSINTLYKNYKYLPYVKIGHSVRFDKLKIDEWLEEQMEKNRNNN